MNVAQMDNAALDLQALRRDRRKAAKGFKFELLDEISIDPSESGKCHIIKGAFAWGETSAWIGPPGSLKSALMASGAIAIASGTDWFGYRNKLKTGVVYFALERADLVKRRLHAMAQRMGLEALPIAVVPAVTDLSKPESVRKVYDTIIEAEAEFFEQFNLPAGVLIFDTWAKLVSAGGGDENLAKDVGPVFANIARLKEKLGGPHVALVGHTGKDVERGPRGSSALVGDIDLLVTISGDDVKTATVTKANDAPEGPLFSFKSEIHEFGIDEDGEPIAVNIVAEAEKAAISKSAEPKLSENQRVMFRLLYEAGLAGLATEEWNDAAKAVGIEKKQRHYELRMALKDKGMIREYAGRWFVDGR